MTAIITNKAADYTYTIGNVTCVNYVETYLIIVAVKNNEVNTYTYNNDDVVVSIIGGEI